MKADLVTYGGMIGFQKTWRILQGYLGRNITKLIADESIKKGIDLIGVMSMDIGGIQKGSVHDRYSILLDHAKKLPAEYFFQELGENLFEVRKGMEGIVRILNGQGIYSIDEEDKQRDFWVLGDNQIPNGLPLEETLNLCDEKGLIKIAPSLSKPSSTKEIKLFGQILKDKYGSQQNRFNALDNNCLEDAYLQLPLIYASKAHSIGEIGTRYTEFETSDIKFLNNDKTLIKFLKDNLKPGIPKPFPGKAPLSAQARWKIPLGAYVVGKKIGEMVEKKLKK